MKTVLIPNSFASRCVVSAKFACLIILTTSPLAAFAQGELTFVNNASFLTPADRLVYDVDGKPLVGTNYVAQLYYGADARTLQAHTAAPSRFRMPTTAYPGMWSGGTRTLTGFPERSLVTMQVKVWDVTRGATFEVARTNGSPWGASMVFTYWVPCCSPNDSFLMDNFRAFALVSERTNLLAISMPEATAVLTFAGPAEIEASSNLTDWISLGTQLSPYDDQAAANLPSRFYRLTGTTNRGPVVGFYLLSLCQGFSLVANQLHTASDTVSNVFKSPPNNTAFFKFDPLAGSYTYLAYVDNTWHGDDTAMSLQPGEGVFCSAPTAFQQAVLGEVLSFAVTPSQPGKWAVISSSIPRSGFLTPDDPLEFPAGQGDIVYLHNPCRYGYIFNQFADGQWEGDSGGSPPFVRLGEAFFCAFQYRKVIEGGTYYVAPTWYHRLPSGQ